MAVFGAVPGAQTFCKYQLLASEPPTLPVGFAISREPPGPALPAGGELCGVLLGRGPALAKTPGPDGPLVLAKTRALAASWVCLTAREARAVAERLGASASPSVEWG